MAQTRTLAPNPGEADAIITEEESDGLVSFFAAKETLALIDEVVAAANESLALLKTGTTPDSDLTERMRRVGLTTLPQLLERYQEQPTLLDAHLEALVDALAQPLRTAMAGGAAHSSASCEVLGVLFHLVYFLCKVRGAKTVVRFLPHEAADLEPTLHQLKATPHSSALWASRYVLLLWLSLVVITPFDLCKIDSTLGGSSVDPNAITNQPNLVDSLIDQAKHFLSSTGKEYEGAAMLLTRLLTRRDIVDTHLPPFLTWCIHEASLLHSDPLPMSSFRLRGIIYTLCTLYKLGPRNLLLPTLSEITPLCTTVAEGSIAQTNSLIRKLIAKLTQRVGLCFLKPKVAKWRYQRGSRSLAANLGKSSAGTRAVAAAATVAMDEDDEDETEIPEEIEEIVHSLLNGLRDKDTIVRWSAAKGVGRISARLPQEFATEIVASVIALFEEDTLPPSAPGSTVPNLAAVSDSTWHGACLAVAELARRGLLMPEWLEKVVPWISLALLFDMKRGSHSIGAHVRDAGNYVCWSFFRAYDPVLLLPHVQTLSRRLIVSATLDREVNVRRAASAAFQEGVGRLGGSGECGAIANGIEVVTIADYFSVGNRVGSVLEVAVTLAGYKEYRSGIISHVAEVMTCHWDKTIRVLASQALYKLTFIDLNLVLTTVLPELILKANSFDLAVRHGSCLAIAEICLAWSQIRYGSPATDASTSTEPPLAATWWTEEENERFIKPITNIIPTFPQSTLDTFGGDLTRIALCHLVACLSTANWPSTYRLDPSKGYDVFLATWWKLVHSTLEHREEGVQEYGARACAALAGYCWPCTGDAGNAQFLEDFVNTICTKIAIAESSAVVIPGASRRGMVDRFPRRGYALAVGMLPQGVVRVFAGRLVKGLVGLVGAVVQGGGGEAEGRRNGVAALVGVYAGLGVEGILRVIPRDLFTESLQALFIGMEDYSIDSRGDVGSWIRESCFKAWPVLIPLFDRVNHTLTQTQQMYLHPETCARAVKSLIRQSVEKIDRVREAAGIALRAVLDLEGVDLGISVEAREAVEVAVAGDVNWLNTAEVYPRMVPLLRFSEFRDDLLVGLVVSVGGMSESLVKFSTLSFVAFVNGLSGEEGEGLTVQRFLRDFTSVFAKPAGIRDRISVSLIEVTDVLVGCGAVARVLEAPQGLKEVEGLFDAVKKEVVRCKDVKKVLAAIKVFTGFATLSGEAATNVRSKALTQLVVYLTHTFPRVRRATSEGLYIALTTCGDEEQAGYEEFIDQMEDILLATNWDEPVAQLKDARAKMAGWLGVKLPVVVKKAVALA
ncbi:hypothetical protein HDU98_010659, partial [Podochytrium sp. JEL0797]